MAVIKGTSSADELIGGAEDDIIKGLGGDDTLWGADGFDQILGGSGADRIDDSVGGDVLSGGSGVDTLRMFYGTFFGGGVGAFEFTFTPSQEMTTPYGSTADGFERVNITGSDFNDTIAGGRNDDTVRGWQGDDWLDGGKGADYLIGDNGADTLNGAGGNDLLSGGGHDDVLEGGAGNDTLVGGSVSDLYSGDDTIRGGLGADHIRIGPDVTTLLYDTSNAGVYVDLILGLGFGGEAQGDVFTRGVFGYTRLVGSEFNDFLVGGESMEGGAGDDRLSADYPTRSLTGGAGLDRFVIQFERDSYAERPTITDFDQSTGEKIDLSLIDASPKSGPQAFEFIGSDPFSGKAGELRYQLTGDGRTAIEMNLDKDLDVEHTVYLDGEYVLTTSDFLL